VIIKRQTHRGYRRLSDLPNYIAEFSAMMKRQSRGDLLRSRRRWELHLRPVLNLKEKEGIHQFRSKRPKSLF
jgi:hypothetical protein